MEYREMRRRDRQLANEESVRILNETFWGTLSLSDENNRPYGVMICHAYEDNKLYFHCATDGFKLDIIEKNPQCCFVVTLNPKFIKMKATIKYESVCAFGTIKIADAAEKGKGYRIFNKRYLGDVPEIITANMKTGAKKSHVLIMTIDHMTGKHND